MRVWPQGANDLPEIKLTARKGRWTRGEGHRAFDIRLVGDDRTQYPTNDRADCRAKGSERTRDGSTDRGPAKRAATKTASNVRALPAAATISSATASRSAALSCCGVLPKRSLAYLTTSSSSGMPFSFRMSLGAFNRQARGAALA